MLWQTSKTEKPFQIDIGSLLRYIRENYKSPMNIEEYVSKIEINIPRASVKIHGCDGQVQTIDCDDADQFCTIHQMSKKAVEIDEEIELLYIS